MARKQAVAKGKSSGKRRGLKPARSTGAEMNGGQSGPMRGANTGTSGGGGVDGTISRTAGAAKKLGGRTKTNAMVTKGGTSGHKPPGGAPSKGMGGRSPTAARIADQAAGGNKSQTTNIPGRHNP